MDSQEVLRSDPQMKVNCDLYRLARFGANLTDSHSCLIFLPAELMAQLTCSPLSRGADENLPLVLAGYHSLSTDVVQNCQIQRGAGLVGWVAKHNRSIHVSPFELDSRTLGIYSTDQQLKSFIGVPVSLDLPNLKVSGAGVIACDSKKSFAFSKLQTKLLENLAAEVSNTIDLLLSYSSQSSSDIAWQTFLRRSEDLSAALGHSSVDIVRMRLANFDYLESILGTSGALALSEQTYRLFQQALPPHFPISRLVNGDIVVCLDSMMTSFYENKFRAICDHIAPLSRRPVFDFVKASSRDKRRRAQAVSIDALVSQTARETRPQQGPLVRLEKEVANEYRRA